MKIALYIEDGIEQIVLTPQTEIEKNILSKFDSNHIVKKYRGEFYGCTGGWTRWNQSNNYIMNDEIGDKSLIFVIKPEEEKS